MLYSVYGHLFPNYDGELVQGLDALYSARHRDHERTHQSSGDWPGALKRASYRALFRGAELVSAQTTLSMGIR
jgi:hypothetical protein